MSLKVKGSNLITGKIFFLMLYQFKFSSTINLLQNSYINHLRVVKCIYCFMDTCGQFTPFCANIF